MRKSKTRFEQIPVEVVKKIAKANADNVLATIPVNKLNSHRSPPLRKEQKASRTPQPKAEINCSICNKPIVFETAKTDESGEAVHEQCYVRKIAKSPTKVRLPLKPVPRILKDCSANDGLP